MVHEVGAEHVMPGSSVVVCMEKLLVAIYSDSHLKGSDGAATALSELFRLRGPTLSSQHLASFARKALAVGSQAVKSSKQHSAAVSAMVQAAKFDLKQVLGELLASEDELEQYLPHPQAVALRAFSAACVAAIVVDRSLGAMLVKILSEMLIEPEGASPDPKQYPSPGPGGYTSLRDMQGKEKASWREELVFLLRAREQLGEKGNEPWDPSRAGRDLPLVTMAQEAQRNVSSNVGTPLVSTGEKGGEKRPFSLRRLNQKRYAAKLLGDLLQEPGARVALEVNKHLLAAALAVRVGAIAIERSIDMDNPASLGAKGSLLADLFDDGALWPEIKATIQHYLTRNKLSSVEQALQTHDTWAGLGSVDYVLDSLISFSLSLFSALPEAGPELAQYLLPLLEPSQHASQRAASVLCFSALVMASDARPPLLLSLAAPTISLARDDSLPSHVRKHVICACSSLFASPEVMAGHGMELAETLLDCSASPLRALQYAAAEVLAGCLAALPLMEARDGEPLTAAKEREPLVEGERRLAPRVKLSIGLWLRAEDATLRASAATLAGALHTFIVPETADNRQLESHTGGPAAAAGQRHGASASGGPGAELGAMVEELLPFLLLALADSAHGVRIASKRAIRQLGMALYAPCSPITQLLQSSALDERWQTDHPLLLSSLLKLFHQHRPDDVQRYLNIVVSSPTKERAEMVAGIATLGGAFLRSSIAVDPVARQLLVLLEYPDLQVRCSAAQALQHFAPSKENSAEAASEGASEARQEGAE